MKEETREKILDELKRIGTLRPKAGLTYALQFYSRIARIGFGISRRELTRPRKELSHLHPRLQHLRPVHGHSQRIRPVLPEEGGNEASQADLRRRGRLPHGKDHGTGGVEKHRQDERLRPPEVLPRLLPIRSPGSTVRRLFPVQVPRQGGRSHPRLRQPGEAHRRRSPNGVAFRGHRQAGAYDWREDP